MRALHRVTAVETAVHQVRRGRRALVLCPEGTRRSRVLGHSDHTAGGPTTLFCCFR